jgi:hypothetical protein
VADDLAWLFVGAANGAWIGALIFYTVLGSDRLTADGAVAAGHWLGVRAQMAADGGDEWRSVEITYPRDCDYGSSPASLIWRRLFGVAALGFWAFVLIVAVPWILSGSDRPLAVAARLVSLLAGFGLTLLGGRTRSTTVPVPRWPRGR